MFQIETFEVLIPFALLILLCVLLHIFKNSVPCRGRIFTTTRDGSIVRTRMAKLSLLQPIPISTEMQPCSRDVRRPLKVETTLLGLRREASGSAPSLPTTASQA